LADPRIAQGNLNRIKASIIWLDVPSLNITPPYLGSDGISLAFDGEATSRIPTMTGIVNSPEPYQAVTITVHMLRTQQLAQLYEDRRQTNTLIGDGTLRPDVQAGGLQPYSLLNMSIANVAELSMAGRDPGYRVTLGGYYIINSNLWD
jgi:hypothetical protein